MPLFSGDIEQTAHFSHTGGCPQPITWRIEHIDPRFDIKSTELRELMSEVGDLWTGAVNENLLTYSDSGEVALNLIYSDEQKFTEDEQKLSRRINSMKLNYYGEKISYQKLSNEHQYKIEKYNETVARYQDKANEYRRVRSRWSDTNVIPREQNEELKSLKRQVDFLNKKRESDLKELNALITKMKQLSSQLNTQADLVNELIYQYREQFASTKTFHQGVYIQAGDQKKINIYQFEDKRKLRLVLAHEVGHALGLRHVSNSKSVMYFLMDEQNRYNLQLSPQDIQAIRERCTE